MLCWSIQALNLIYSHNMAYSKGDVTAQQGRDTVLWLEETPVIHKHSKHFRRWFYRVLKITKCSIKCAINSTFQDVNLTSLESLNLCFNFGILQQKR
jgi:predicted fused transcriptional regulator/phosphomethylpyrimidine kinase